MATVELLARQYRSQADPPVLRATDLKPLDQLPEARDLLTRLNIAFSQQSPEVFEECGTIVLSPDVPADLPPLEEARSRGALVIGEVELAAPFLKGKTIGISSFGSDTDLSMKIYAASGKLDPEKDIKLVEIGFSLSEDALRSGRVDSAVMNQPFAARAEAKGGVRKLFSLSEQQKNIVHILEACRAEFVDRNPDAAKAYVRDITLGMKKALENRDETLKVVNEVMKAPIAVLETYLLKDNDFGRDPGAAPNFPAIQTMLDTYADTAMLPKKMDVAQFKHPAIVAPLK